MRAPLLGSCSFPGLGMRTMKLLLLLVSLSASDLRPLGDEDSVKDYCSWSLCRKLLLSEHMAPRGLRTHMVKWCLCIQNYSHVAAQHKQWIGHRASHRAIAGMIHYSHFPITIGFLLLKEGKRFPEFLASDALPGLCCISGDTGGGISYIAVNNVNQCPDSQSVRFLHLRSAASRSDSQTFLLEKSESGATATTAQRQMLTKTNGAAAVVIISCCLKDCETRSAITMKKIRSRQIAELQTGQKDDKQQARDIKYLKQDDGQHPTAASINQQEFGEASAPNSVKTSDLSESKTQRNAAGLVKTNEHLNLDDEPSLQKSPQEQFLIKSVSRVDNDGDGFYGNRQLLLVSREKEATERQLYDLRPAHGNKNTFNRKKITQKQAELRPAEGESEKLDSRLNTVQDGNQTANVLKSDPTEEREEGLIILFLPDTQMETKTDPASARTLTLNTDRGREAVKELSGRPPITFAQLITFYLLELNVIDKTLVKDLKSAESLTKAPTAKVVKETVNAETENMTINHIKPEGIVLPEESAIPAPPSNKVIEAETMKAAAVNMDIKETTSRMDAFNQSRVWKADGLPRTEETSTSTSSPEPGTESEPRCVKCNTRTPELGTGKLLTGLRMREDVLADLMKLHRSEVKNADVAPANRPGNGSEDDDPGGNSLKCSKPSEMGHERAPDSRGTTAKATDESMCPGLIHRTAAGWKHCVERFTGAKTQPEPERPRTDPEDSSPNDEYDHFYYFDGVLRRVQSHFYLWRSNVPAVRRQRRTRSLLSYIQHLVLKNKRSGR